jgi:adenine-specific DNA methylase
VTDPPYFDYIAYSELSEFFRLWLREPGLAGAPLLPGTESPVESFAVSLGGALKVTLTRLRPGAPLVFTYHSANPNAWIAIGDAFDIADLAVVALWPVLADPHMGHHAAEGNCEWDVVVVARRTGEVEAVSEDEVRDLSLEWLDDIRTSEFKVGLGDQASFKHAWMMSKSRFGRSRYRPD